MKKLQLIAESSDIRYSLYLRFGTAQKRPFLGVPMYIRYVLPHGRISNLLKNDWRACEAQKSCNEIEDSLLYFLASFFFLKIHFRSDWQSMFDFRSLPVEGRGRRETAAGFIRYSIQFRARKFFRPFFIFESTSTCRKMAFSQLFSQILFCAVVMEQIRSVFSFPLQAAALMDSVPMFSDKSQRQWHREIYEDEFTDVLKDEVVQRLNDLGRVSDAEEFLQRTFMSPAAVRAGNLIRTWMTDAGLFTWIDDIGNVHGRCDGRNPSAPALLIGSHLDTVIDAGRYDGALGILTAIAAVKALQKTGRLVDFPRPMEVIAFSDEEGIRFQSTFLGSGAITGTLSPNLLQVKDKSGVTVQKAIQSTSLPGTPASLASLKYEPESVWGYLEVHIEQGPVLESKDLPLGVVDAIAGQTRLRVSMRGVVGHAGTVPMTMRRDPMPAAGLAIVAIEELCMHPEDTLSKGKALKENFLVCTVGEVAAWPGASNVIPGEVIFSVDVRAKSDNLREAAVSTMENAIYDICRNRAIACDIEHKHEAKTVECDSNLTERLQAAASLATHKIYSGRNNTSPNVEDNRSVPSISSGAGHDALAMAHITKVGMVFVRCAGGISHSPAEDVLEEDVWAAGLALYSFLLQELESDELTVEYSTRAFHSHHYSG